MISYEFIAGLESAFGKYKEGMRIIISTRINNASEEALTALYKAIADGYDGIRPPTWNKILSFAISNGIYLRTEKPSYYVRVCEFCDTRYPIDEEKCPACGKPPLFGGVEKRYKE